MRSIFRSYAFRGLVGFGTWGVLIGLLYAWRNPEAPASVHVLVFVGRMMTTLVCSTVTAAMLIDGERSVNRFDAALVSGVIFTLTLVASLSYMSVFYEGKVYWLKPSAVGVPLGAAGGLAAGFTIFYLKHHETPYANSPCSGNCCVVVGSDSFSGEQVGKLSRVAP